MYPTMISEKADALRRGRMLFIVDDSFAHLEDDDQMSNVPYKLVYLSEHGLNEVEIFDCICSCGPLFNRNTLMVKDIKFTRFAEWRGAKNEPEGEFLFLCMAFDAAKNWAVNTHKDLLRISARTSKLRTLVDALLEEKFSLRVYRDRYGARTDKISARKEIV